MGPDLPPNPPEAAPQAAIVAPAKQMAEPIVAESHGYRYTVTGNTLLGPETIISSLETAETPKDAIESLNRAYLRAGHFLTALRADVDGQKVAIRVLHGRITEEDLVPSLAPYFAGIEGREDLDRNTVIRKSVLAEAYAARQGMRPKVDFVPAREPGGSKITVSEEPIEGAKPWNAGLGFGNFGNRYSSRYLVQGNAAVRPGNGVELTANYAHGLPDLADDSRGSQYDTGSVGASAVTPWGLYGATYGRSKYRIGEKTAPLYPEGDITIWGVNGTQLAYADEAARWAFTEAFTRTANVVTAFGGAYTLTDQHYDFVSLGTSFSRSFLAFEKNASFGAGLTVSKGLSSRAGTFLPDTPTIPDPGFTLYQGNLSYTQSLPKGFSAGLSWSGQWADATLPQNQQWVLGGFGNLTAWMPSILVGDSGTLARASLSTPAWEWSGLSLTGGAFVEAGSVRTHYIPAGSPASRYLSDAGLSLSGSMKSGTSLTLAYAWPLGSGNVDQKTLDEVGNRARLFFSLNQSF
jgi:hemolysin activation/secretion protein